MIISKSCYDKLITTLANLEVEEVYSESDKEISSILVSPSKINLELLLEFLASLLDSMPIPLSESELSLLKYLREEMDELNNLLSLANDQVELDESIDIMDILIKVSPHLDDYLYISYSSELDRYLIEGVGYSEYCKEELDIYKLLNYVSDLFKSVGLSSSGKLLLTTAELIESDLGTDLICNNDNNSLIGVLDKLDSISELALETLVYSLVIIAKTSSLDRRENIIRDLMTKIEELNLSKSTNKY